eukprot:TRINITY_DN56768_c0_g1_i1.p1 TRINITY_DN56768_c0_g1~~TRINITY_DN56768_c0_g1_i1.p1  ORF type:complete len:114 (+),score=28.56 TRINITY_DN56768_c0_g1_i1:91-432(+)
MSAVDSASSKQEEAQPASESVAASSDEGTAAGGVVKATEKTFKGWGFCQLSPEDQLRCWQHRQQVRWTKMQEQQAASLPMSPQMAKLEPAKFDPCREYQSQMQKALLEGAVIC